MSERLSEQRAMTAQVGALAGVARTTRDAARAQVQPVVFGNTYGGPKVGPSDDFDIDEDEAAVPYYVSNEGTGLALDVEHGIEVGGVEYAFGAGCGS